MPVTKAIRIQGHSSGGELLDKANLYFRIISIYLVQAFPVKPPKMFPPLFTTVTVGTLLSHLK